MSNVFRAMFLTIANANKLSEIEALNEIMGEMEIIDMNFPAEKYEDFNEEERLTILLVLRMREQAILYKELYEACKKE